jgi:hypothetical protein
MIHTLASFSLLAVLSVAYLTAVRRIERLRLVVTNRQVCNMLGTFTFAGTVLFDPEFIALLTGIVYVAAWPTFRKAGTPGHRHAYNAANVTLACFAASWVLQRQPAGLGIPTAIAVFMVLNVMLSLGAVIAARHWHSLQTFRNPRNYWVSLSTQACGAAVGMCMQWHTSLAVVGIPVLAAIHSDAVRGAIRDSGAMKDGVCNREVWLHLADETFRRGEWFAAVLVETAAGAAQQSALTVLLTHARPGKDVTDAAGPAREPDAVGIYSPTQLLLLRHMSTAAASRGTARKIAEDMKLLGLAGGVGVSGSKQESVAAVLAIASAESALYQVAPVSDSDEVH